MKNDSRFEGRQASASVSTAKIAVSVEVREQDTLEGLAMTVIHSSGIIITVEGWQYNHLAGMLTL